MCAVCIAKSRARDNMHVVCIRAHRLSLPVLHALTEMNTCGWATNLQVVIIAKRSHMAAQPGWQLTNAGTDYGPLSHGASWRC